MKHSRSCRIHDCSSGTSAVEFGLVAPVVLLMLCAIVQFSFIFYTFNTAQQAGWVVARQVATGGMAASGAVSLVRSKLPPWAQTAASIAPVVLNNGTYTVSITVPLVSASPVNFLASTWGTSSLTTTATFYSEVN